MALPSKLTADEAERLFQRLGGYPQLALAVSGGPDSLALLQLLHRWRVGRSDGPTLTVLTVDHGLRSGSREEGLMVARMCAGLGIPHALLTWREADKGVGGLQDLARRARYRLMAEYCHLHDIPALVTAHQLDDQAETLLMRLKRGSGLDGLAAIPEQGSWAGIELLRPLLSVPKSRLIATLLDAGIAWAEDSSNADPRFERARVRASSAAFAALGLTPEALARSAQRLTRARAALDYATDKFLAEHGRMSAAGYGILQREALTAAPDEIALRALARLVQAVGARDLPIRLAKLEALLEGLKQEPAKTQTLGGCRIEKLGTRLGVFRETRGTGLPALRLAAGERALWDNRFTVELGIGTAGDVTVRALGEDGFKQARASDWLLSLPRRAGITLPSCWRGDELLALPDLAAAASFSRGAGQGRFRARFVNADRLPIETDGIEASR